MRKLENFEIAGLSTVSVAIHRHSKISDLAFRVFCTSSRTDASQEELASSLQKSLGESFQVLVETVGPRQVKGRIPVYSGIVLANVAVKPYTEENTAKLKLVTANVFRDPEDGSLWKKVGEGDAEHLVQTSRDNFEEMLALRRATGVTPVLAAIDSEASSEGSTVGDFVIYFDPNKMQMDSGFLLNAGKEVSIATNEKVTQVSEDCIVGHVEGVRDETLASTLHVDANKVVEYYKKLYGDNSPLFKRMKELVAQFNKRAA